MHMRYKNFSHHTFLPIAIHIWKKFFKKLLQICWGDIIFAIPFENMENLMSKLREKNCNSMYIHTRYFSNRKVWMIKYNESWNSCEKMGKVLSFLMTFRHVKKLGINILYDAKYSATKRWQSLKTIVLFFNNHL